MKFQSLTIATNKPCKSVFCRCYLECGMKNSHHIIAISQLRRLSSAAVHQWIFAAEHPGKICCIYTHHHLEYCTWSRPHLMSFPKFCLSAKGCIMPCNTWWLQSAHVEMQNFSTKSLQQDRWMTIPHHGQISSWGGGLVTELCILSSRKIMYIAPIARSSPELFEKVRVWGVDLAPPVPKYPRTSEEFLSK